MFIAQISDTHILAHASDHPAAQLRADSLRQCIADINEQQPDAVIFTGDTVQHGRPDEYARLQELLQPLNAPLYLIPGNRDDKEALRNAFGEHFPEKGDFLQYAVEDFEFRLIAIDSTFAGERKGVFCSEREVWLDKTLSEQPNRPTLLFIHHPPFDVADHYIGGYRRAAEAAALTHVVSRHPQVEVMLCGHVHCPGEHQWAGTVACLMPSVAADLRKGVDETEAGGPPLYMLHQLTAGSKRVSVPRSALSSASIPMGTTV